MYASCINHVLMWVFLDKLAEICSTLSNIVLEGTI